LRFIGKIRDSCDLDGALDGRDVATPPSRRGPSRARRLEKERPSPACAAAAPPLVGGCCDGSAPASAAGAGSADVLNARQGAASPRPAAAADAPRAAADWLQSAAEASAPLAPAGVRGGAAAASAASSCAPRRPARARRRIARRQERPPSADRQLAVTWRAHRTTRSWPADARCGAPVAFAARRGVAAGRGACSTRCQSGASDSLRAARCHGRSRGGGGGAAPAGGAAEQGRPFRRCAQQRIRPQRR
jgi:hypothetical protein